MRLFSLVISFFSTEETLEKFWILSQLFAYIIANINIWIQKVFWSLEKNSFIYYIRKYAHL